MLPLSVGDFLAHLRKSNVLSSDQWARMRRECPAAAAGDPSPSGGPVRKDSASSTSKPTAEVVDWLIRKGWLTRWQADMLLSGRTTLFLGKYRLLECIGTGGMGAVFKARHAQMERTVALKVMSSAVIRKRKAVARFHKEIQAAAALDHPNIVTAFDADCVGNVHFLVMEYVDGHDLGWYVAQKGALPIGWSCECIRQAALGLQHAHERGMVHRDIKPTNVLVTRDPESGRPLAKLLDLGLARFSTEAELVDDESSSQLAGGSELTQAGQVLGTPDYMAPEQAANTRAADARSDVFSLGCTLFRLITGEFPFTGETAAEKIKARQQGPASRIRALRADVPPALEEIIAKMMATDPQKRFSTARDVATALAPFSTADETSVPPVTTGNSTAAVSTHGIQPDEDPRLRQFFTHLAHQAVEETSNRSDLTSWIATASRKTKLTILGTAVFLMLLIAGWYWGGQATLDVDWPATQRRQGALTVNGRDVAVPSERAVKVTGRSGRWNIRMTRPGYEPVVEALEFGFGERKQFAPVWRPLPQTVRKDELATLKRRATEVASIDSPGAPLLELRSNLARFRSRFTATEEADAATLLLAKLPSLLDSLSRATIPDSALRQAGMGDPKQAPGPIVSILGDGRSTFWNRVVAFAASLDGQWLAAASLDGTVRIFDRRSATEQHILRLSADPRDIAFSSKDNTLAVAGNRREVTLWNPDDGTLQKSLRDALEPLAFSPDGSILATGGRRNDILLFDTETRTLRQSLTGPPGSAPRYLTFSPDGRRLASQGADSAVALWLVLSGGEPVRIQRSSRPRFSPDSKLLATASGDGDLRVWSADDGSLQRLLRRGGDPLGFAPDGKTLVSHRSGRAMIWDLETGEERRVFSGVPAVVAVSPDGQTLAAANPNLPDLRFWNLATGTSLSVTGLSGPIASLAFTPDSARVISGGADHVVRQWNPANGTEETGLGPAWGPVAMDPEGRLVAIARPPKVELWDVAKPAQPVRLLAEDAPDLVQLAWSPAGGLIGGCGGARFLKSAARIWEAETGQELEFDNDQTGGMRVLAFGASGQRLATVGDGRKVVLWDVAKRSVLQAFESAPEKPVSLAFDRERRKLAAAGSTDSIAIWDLQSKSARAIATEAKVAIRQIAFSPDGKSLLAATANGIAIRDAVLGNVLRTLSCRPGAPTSLAFSPSGDRLAVVGNLGIVWLWTWPAKGLPTEEADTKISIGPSGGLIRQVAWSLDGRHLLTVNGNSTLFVLRLAEQPIAE